MFSRSHAGLRLNWPMVVLAAVAALFVIQMMRVNRPQKNPPPSSVYTEDGPLLSGTLTIPAGDFYSKRIELNRPARLSGYFRTAARSIEVKTLILREADLDPWKAGLEYKSVAETKRVHGGRFDTVLQPGVYFLIIDNRGNSAAAIADAQFIID